MTTPLRHIFFFASVIENDSPKSMVRERSQTGLPSCSFHGAERAEVRSQWSEETRSFTEL